MSSPSLALTRTLVRAAVMDFSVYIEVRGTPSDDWVRIGTLYFGRGGGVDIRVNQDMTLHISADDAAGMGVGNLDCGTVVLCPRECTKEGQGKRRIYCRSTRDFADLPEGYSDGRPRRADDFAYWNGAGGS